MKTKKQTFEATPLTTGALSTGAGVLLKNIENFAGLHLDTNIIHNVSMSNFLIGVGLATVGYSLFNQTSKITETLTICGLSKTYNDKIYVPKVIKTVKKNGKKIYHLTLPVGLCLTDFKSKQEEIEQALGKGVKFEYNNKRIFMTVHDKQLLHTYPFEQKELKGDLPIVIGHTQDGVKTIDLATSPSPHVGVFGETNGGKSVILRGLLTQLILNKTPEQLQIHLIDLKRVEFALFKKSNMVKSFSNTIEQADEILNKICELTDKRYKKLEQAEVVNLKEYNSKSKTKMPYILVVIDEFTDLNESNKAIDYMNYIARKARAVGIHLIISTQRPDKDILDGKIKANIGNIVGLKTTTGVNSQIIIDQTGLENLRGFGNGMLKMGCELTEFQSEYLSGNDATKLIKHTFIEQIGQMKMTPYIDTSKIEPQPKKVRGYINAC